MARFLSFWRKDGFVLVLRSWLERERIGAFAVRFLSIIRCCLGIRLFIRALSFISVSSAVRFLSRVLFFCGIS